MMQRVIEESVSVEEATLIKYRVKPEFRFGIEDYMRGNLYLIEFDSLRLQCLMENSQGQRIKVSNEYLRDCMYQVMPELEFPNEVADGD